MFDHQPGGVKVGEKSLIFRQGEKTLSEYALELCTLVADSGWNDLALKAVFCQGLEASILTELTCRDEQYTLDLLMDLAIKLDHLF